MHTNRITLAIAGFATAVVLAACGQSGSQTAESSGSSASTGASSSVSSQHSDADVTFAQSMIPRHQQAIAMADLAATRASNQQVKDFAATIKAAQAPEIETMTGWLTAWGESTAAASGMGHDMGSMPGMMSDDDMNSLMGMSGGDFDRRFLTMMISHHQGAVEMANTEQAQGSSAEAKAIAAKIVKDQTAEIARMQTLLTQV
ncbi:MAG: hypothetical protein JWQ26_3424 [Modestobacter sp.]|jgi:uncharacterized protein (DUF305 family)|nr:hypothetical protein [Modestobacter sp.]